MWPTKASTTARLFNRERRRRVRGNGKELKEAKRFLEAFGIDDDESVDAVRRCSTRC